MQKMYSNHAWDQHWAMLLLLNANTLTKLHFKSNVEILIGFQSIDAFYKLLMRLPVLNDLQVSGDIISIVALKQVSPSLTNLRLISKDPKYKRVPGYFQNLLTPVELSGPEWSCLSERTDIRPIGSLSLNFIVSSTELHWVLAHIPTIQHISLALDAQYLKASIHGIPLELYRNLRSLTITRYRSGQEWELWELFTYLVTVLPHLPKLNTLVLPALFYNNDAFDLLRRCQQQNLASIRVVKHVPSK
ncbi:hypothetical protein BGZ92_006052 [Podila epicladia]|nr:hypothetical protein BGZ92_006052 [Podila epicladia]